MNIFGGALQPAPVNRSRRWIAWGAAFLGVAVCAVAGQQIYVRVGAAPGADEGHEMSPALRRTISELQLFIENERGLEFKEEVKVTLLSEKEFTEYISGGAESNAEAEEVDAGQVIFEALGLMDKNLDLSGIGESAASEGLLGWYDAEADELFVRGNRISPFIKTILVHELTHALQDQHFDIIREELYEADDDSSMGLEAVVEGDAQRVEYAYYESLNAEEERLVELEANDAGEPGTTEVPDALIAFMGLPYQLGPNFVEVMFQTGGNAKINEALKNPPVTSEQLLNPELYLSGEKAKPVAKPPADGEVLDDGMFSQVALILLLNEAMDPETAFEAADGWGGDQYVVWRNGDQSCVRFDMVMDTPRDQRELNSALRNWAGQHGSATVTTVGGATRMTACA